MPLIRILLRWLILLLGGTGTLIIHAFCLTLRNVIADQAPRRRPYHHNSWNLITPSRKSILATPRNPCKVSQQQLHQHDEDGPSLCQVKDNDKTSTPPLPIRGTTSSIVLLSLQWSFDDQQSTNNKNHGRRFSSTVRSVWRWKDEVLGDGRDFFVPKPKTIAALQSYLASSVAHGQECTVVVLSNCARFEIIVSGRDSNDHTLTASALVTQISALLLAQVESHRKRRFQLHLPLDLPGALDRNVFKDRRNEPHIDTVNDLSRHWTVLEGSHRVAQHLALVAAGMAVRPRRPDRPVLFQPFSSRDAHILLQLKRTLAVATQQQKQKQQNSSECSLVLQLLLQYALQAGKAARNPAVVPELRELQQYGTGDNNRKYDATPPLALSQRIATVARQRAVDPIVQDCVERLEGLAYTERICNFRERALSLARDSAERIRVQQLIHEPTLQLRQGVDVNVESILECIEKDLSRIRSQ